MGNELAFNADVFIPEPDITSISPTSGSIAGGTQVTIAGHDFTGASAVKFGDTPATGYSEFTYTACVVPKLKDKKLKADRRKLTKAGCKLGKVKGHKSKSARVKKQNPKPGTVLPPGAKVNVKLGG